MLLQIYISADEVRGSGSWVDNRSLDQAKDFLDGSQVSKFVDGLDIEAQIDFYQKVGGLRIGDRGTSGTNLKHWEKDVYEVKFYKNRYRLFVLIHEDKCVLLYACQKQKNKTENVDSENVRNRANSVREKLEV